MNNNNTRLSCYVKAQNRANSIINLLVPAKLAILREFLGKKIQKIDNTLLSKVMEKLNEVNTNHSQVYYSTSSFCIWLHVKTWESDDNGHAYYKEASYWLGELKDGVLIAVNAQFEPLKNDFSVENIMEVRARVEKLKAELDKEKEGLYGFGEYDN